MGGITLSLEGMQLMPTDPVERVKYLSDNFNANTARLTARVNALPTNAKQDNRIANLVVSAAAWKTQFESNRLNFTEVQWRQYCTDVVQFVATLETVEKEIAEAKRAAKLASETESKRRQDQFNRAD